MSGWQVTIRNVDHDPPHCHIYIEGRDAQVDLRTLEVRNPPPHRLPPNLRRGLAEIQEELLEAWERVTIIPPGSSPGVW